MARVDILSDSLWSSAARAEFWHPAEAQAATGAPPGNPSPCSLRLTRPLRGLTRRLAALTFTRMPAAGCPCCGRLGTGDELLLPGRRLALEVAGR